MVTKIKKKRPITAPDEFISMPNRILNYIQENPKKVIFVSIVLTLVILSSLLGRHWYKKKKEHALSFYAQAERLLNENKKEEAIKIFNQILEKYPRMGIAKFSYLKLAYIYEQNGNYKEAISLYESYLKGTKGNNSLRPFVLHAIICDYEKLGKMDLAKKYLRTMIEKWKGHPLSSWAYAQLGLILEGEGKVSEAYNMYKSALAAKNNLTSATPFGPAWLELKLKALSNQKNLARDGLP